MTTILNAGPNGSINTLSPNAFPLLPSQSSASSFTLSFQNTQTITYSGNFIYDSSGYVASGTITGGWSVYNGALLWEAGGLNIPVADYLTAFRSPTGNDLDEGIFTPALAFNTGGASITGGVNSDQLYASTFSDTIFGGGGGDAIWASNGDDFINGNMGDDQLEGHSGNDTIRGGKDDDYIGVAVEFGGGDGAGNDQFFGDLGNDSVDGGIDQDLVRGGKGEDSMLGGAGNDTLWGDLGNDTMTGGAGDDTFAFAAGSGVDVITDFGTGTDMLQISSAVFANAAAAVAAFSNGVLDFGGGNSVTLTGVVSLDSGDVVIV